MEYFSLKMGEEPKKRKYSKYNSITDDEKIFWTEPRRKRAMKRLMSAEIMIIIIHDGFNKVESVFFFLLEFNLQSLFLSFF